MMIVSRGFSVGRRRYVRLEFPPPVICRDRPSAPRDPTITLESTMHGPRATSGLSEHITRGGNSRRIASRFHVIGHSQSLHCQSTRCPPSNVGATTDVHRVEDLNNQVSTSRAKWYVTRGMGDVTDWPKHLIVYGFSTPESVDELLRYHPIMN
jgi:hypothetical protein